MQTCYLPLLLAALFALIHPATGGEKVSSTPPAVYQEAIEALLTPAEPLLKAEAPAHEDADAGVVLLNELVTHVLPDGRRITAEHYVSRALTDGGAEGISREVISYDKSRQTMHLVMARTITPQGKKLPVQPGAVFLQTPQRSADDAIYTDNAELVVIFPDVKAGSVTEYIVVREETKSRIPLHFTALYSLAGGWPTRVLRRVTTLPDPMAEKLLITPLGSGLPESRREAADGRTRLTWERRDVPAPHQEPDRAPVDQAGPCVFLSTIPDWETFLHWYAPLAEQKMKLGAALEASVSEWTREAKSPREIVAILSARVSRDVRYVGLEFNECDLEPHPVQEVWEHQYGDCKDKASLLCAMLRHCGIKSYMGLLNTKHAGRIERRSPDYRHFDHAIAVAMLEDGPLFIDATLSGAEPGMLSPGDSDREVLLVREPVEWLRTLASSAGSYLLDFDITVAADGGLSGWGRMLASGYIGTLYADAERTGTRESLKAMLNSRISRTLPEARVVDVKTESAKSGEPYAVQAYLIVPSAGALTLRVPFAESMLPDPGDATGRETELSVWQEKTGATASYTLPAGYTAEALPPPFRIETAFGNGTAGWEKTGNGLKASFLWEGKVTRVPAADCAALAAAVSSLRTWLAKPITLTQGKAAPADVPQDALTDFPMMPTSEGQLALINEKYPLEGNHELRRSALEKTLTFFQQDKELQFLASVQIAYLDVLEDKPAAALQRLRGPLEAQRGAVDAESLALGEYVQAMALQADHQADAAREIFQRLSTNAALSSTRRAWAYWQLADGIRASNPAAALEAIRAGLGMAGGNEEDLFALLADMGLNQEKGAAFSSELTAWLKKEPGSASAVMLSLAQVARNWLPARPADADALVAILQKAGDPNRYGAVYTSTIQSVQKARSSALAYGAIRSRLKEWVAGNAGELPKMEIPEEWKTREDFTRAIEEEGEKGEPDPARLLHMRMEVLLRFEPDTEFGTHLHISASLAHLMGSKAKQKSPSPIEKEFLALCEMTPPGCDARLEGRFLQAASLSEVEKYLEASSLLRTIANEPDLEPGYFITAIQRLALNLEAGGKDKEALLEWKRIETLTSFSVAADGLLRAALLCLENGLPDEAIRILNVLRKFDAKIIAEAEAKEQIVQLLALSADPDKARRAWTAAADWWPHWEEFATKAGLPAADKHSTFPVLNDIPQRLGAIAHLYKRKDAQKGGILFHQIAKAARWDPSIATTLASILFNLDQLGLATAAPEFRKLVISIMEHSPPDDEQAYAKLLLAGMVACHDSGEHTKCLATVPIYEKLGEAARSLPMDAAFARLHSLSAVATGRELSESAVRLEKALQSEKEDPDRTRSVICLAEVYHRQNRAADELALLTRELHPPGSAKDEEPDREIERRLKVLKESGSGDAIGHAARAWLQAGRPDWLDHVSPKDLSDPRFANPREVIFEVPLPLHSIIKFYHLVILDATQPEDLRQSSLQFFAGFIPFIARDEAQALKWIRAITDLEQLPQPIRATCYSYFINAAAKAESLSLIAQAKNEELIEALSPRERNYQTMVQRYASLPPHNLDAAERLAYELLEDPVTVDTSRIISSLAVRIFSRGRPDKARSIHGRIRQAQMDLSFQDEKSAFQISLLDKFRKIEKLQPLHQSMRSLWLKSRPTAPAKVPSLVIPDQVRYLENSEALAFAEAQLHQDTWDRTKADYWTDMIDNLPKDKETRPFAFELLKTFLEKAPDDATRALGIQGMVTSINMDDSALRQQVMEVFKPYRNLMDSPQTRDVLRSVDLHIRLNEAEGSPSEWVDDLLAITDQRISSMSFAKVTEACVAAGDTAAVSRLMSARSASFWLEGPLRAEAINAWGFLKMNEEADLAMDAVPEQIESIIYKAWAQLDGAGAKIGLEYAALVGKPELVPEAFIRAIGRDCRRSYFRYAVTASHADIHEQWDACLKAAQEGCEAFPDWQIFSYYKGKALVHLNRKAEAVAPLQFFLKCEKSGRKGIEAAKLLKEAATP